MKYFQSGCKKSTCRVYVYSKKKHLGEFKEIGFDFKLSFTPIYNDEKHFEMIDHIFWLIEQHGFFATGSCGAGEIDGCMSVQSYRINAEAMKAKLQAALLAIPDVTSVEFSENCDSWYGPFNE